MKKLLLLLIPFLFTITAYSQNGYSSVFLRVTDSATFVNSANTTAKHAANYADIWYSTVSGLFWKWSTVTNTYTMISEGGNFWKNAGTTNITNANIVAAGGESFDISSVGANTDSKITFNGAAGTTSIEANTSINLGVFDGVTTSNVQVTPGAFQLFDSEIIIDGVSGTAGQVPTSQGAGLPVIWGSGSGGTIDGSGTTNELPYWVDSNTLGSLAVATYPSLTELSYGKGVTSAIQTQLNTKAPYRQVTIASTPVINQPAYSADVGYYLFYPEVSTIVPRVYLIPNNPGDGTRWKLEGFNTDYASGSTNYAGFNMFGTTTAGAHVTNFGPNRGGTGTRGTFILGSYVGSSQESLTSELRMLTDNTWNIKGGGLNYESVSGTDFFGINSAGSILLSGSAGTSGFVLTSQGSAAPPIWSSPAVIASVSTSTAGATITLNMDSKTQLIHVGSATFATAKVVAMSNTSTALAFSFIFEVTNVAAVLTTPADWLMTTVDFDGIDWTPPATGRYKFSGTYDGTNWYVNANGPYN